MDSSKILIAATFNNSFYLVNRGCSCYFGFILWKINLNNYQCVLGAVYMRWNTSCLTWVRYFSSRVYTRKISHLSEILCISLYIKSENSTCSWYKLQFIKPLAQVVPNLLLLFHWLSGSHTYETVKIKRCKIFPLVIIKTGSFNQ